MSLVSFHDEEQEQLFQLQAVLQQLHELDQLGDPTTYGLPSLVFEQEEGESDDDFRRRQFAGLKDMVESRLWIEKDGQTHYLKLIPPMLEMIGDVFFGYVRRAILWKPRGAGGSLAASILIWLLMVYRKLSFMDMAGSGEQGKVVYNYVKQFWRCVPGMEQDLLDGDPLISNTALVTGVNLRCVPASEKQVRSKHVPGLIVDEACQEQAGTDKIFEAAMQGPLSEHTHVILLLSTFHVPVGFFAEIWDNFDEKGFTRYKWDVYDAMEQCSKDYYCTPEEAPKGWDDDKLCPLTRWRDEFNERGQVVGKEQIGCRGKGRHTEGFKTWEQVYESYRMNLGSEAFEIEHECGLPGTLVLTDSGFVPIEDVQEGQQVWTHRGRWRSASPMQRDYSGSVVSFKGPGRPRMTFTPNHPIFQREGGRESWCLTASLSEGRKEGALPLPTVSESPESQTYQEVRAGRGPPESRTHTMEVPRGAEAFELYGLFLGDGWYETCRGRGRMGLTSTDPEILERWSHLAKSVFGRTASEVTESPHSSFAVKGFVDWMLERSGRHSHEKHLPPSLFRTMTDEEKRAFLIGYTVTDGCVEESAIRWRSTSSRLLGQVHWILLSLGFASTLSETPAMEKMWPDGKIRTSRKQWVLRLSKTYFKQFCAWSRGDPVDPVDLHGAPIRIVDGFMTSVISEVSEETYSGPIYNLQVEEDESYCIPGMAVHNCNRPDWSARIIPEKQIDFSLIDEMMHCADNMRAVGIDWGLIGQTGLHLIERWRGRMAPVSEEVTMEDIEKAIEENAMEDDGYLGVLESQFFTGSLTSEIMKVLRVWQKKYGPFIVLADQSHPFNNLELSKAGFTVVPVGFGKWKDFGYANLRKYFQFGRLKILREHRELIRQLRKLRRDSDGKIKKVDDHGPDSLMCAVLRFVFSSEFPYDAGIENDEQASRERQKVLLFG